MESELLPSDVELSLHRSFHSTSPVSGFTHNFYRYPARMSPDFAREVIDRFSRPEDVVLDPFLGGGTTLVEALASGRKSVGVDLNPLAVFVSAAKTTPLSKRDVSIVARWVEAAPFSELMPPSSDTTVIDPRVKNLPPPLVSIFDRLLRHLLELPFPRQRRFARCALLRLGQWAVDGRSGVPEPGKLKDELEQMIQDMLIGLDRLVQAAAACGVEKRRMTEQRAIMLRSVIGLEDDLDVTSIGRPRLVLTSPPYPAVHVLYNRWQVDGRRETPAPYWLIDAPDGRGASYFTMGSRTSFGVENYYRSLTAAFRSVRAIIDPDGVVVQLVSFADRNTQLPAFLQAMEAAGFREDAESASSRAERWRTVPNRKWYYRVDAARNSAQELLLIHRPDESLATA